MLTNFFIILLLSPLVMFCILAVLTPFGTLVRIYHVLITCILSFILPCEIYFWAAGKLPKQLIFSDENLVFIFDDLSAPFILLTALIFPLCLYYSYYTQAVKDNHIIMLLITLLWFILNFLFLIGNLFYFYVLFEMSLLPVLFFFTLSARSRKLRAAAFFFIYTAAFSYFLLLGMAQLWTWAHTYDYSLLKYLFSSTSFLSSDQRLYLFVLFLLALFAKIPLMPFHIWLPEAHVEAPTVGSVILASLLLKVGSYGIMRFVVSFFYQEILMYITILEVLIVLSGFYSTLIAMSQVDLKRVIAYSSIAHMSFATLGIFSQDIYGKWGGLLYNIGHSFISAALFFFVGILYTRFGTRLIKYYSGLMVLPNLASFAFFFFFANIGFPGTINFVSEFLILLSLIIRNQWFLLVPFMLSFVMSLFYSVWVYLRLFYGVFNTNYLPVAGDLTLVEKNIFFILAFCTLIFGLIPNLIVALGYHVY